MNMLPSMLFETISADQTRLIQWHLLQTTKNRNIPVPNPVTQGIKRQKPYSKSTILIGTRCSGMILVYLLIMESMQAEIVSTRWSKLLWEKNGFKLDQRDSNPRRRPQLIPICRKAQGAQGFRKVRECQKVPF